MDFKNLSDAELASVMVNRINRVEYLMEMIEGYLESQNHESVLASNIKTEYKDLKDELRKNAKYLNLVRNYEGSKLYMHYFSPSIREASAWGFTVSTNSTINQAMHSAVEEAHYKLTKYYSLEEWGALI